MPKLFCKLIAFHSTFICYRTQIKCYAIPIWMRIQKSIHWQKATPSQLFTSNYVVKWLIQELMRKQTKNRNVVIDQNHSTFLIQGHLHNSRPKKRQKQPARGYQQEASIVLLAHTHILLVRTVYHTFMWKSAQLCFGGSLLAIRWHCLWVGKDDNINKVMSLLQNIYTT